MLRSMVGKNAHNYSFRKKDQAVTLACKTAVRQRPGRSTVAVPEIEFCSNWRTV